MHRKTIHTIFKLSGNIAPTKCHLNRICTLDRTWSKGQHIPLRPFVPVRFVAQKEKIVQIPIHVYMAWITVPKGHRSRSSRSWGTTNRDTKPFHRKHKFSTVVVQSTCNKRCVRKVTDRRQKTRNPGHKMHHNWRTNDVQTSKLLATLWPRSTAYGKLPQLRT